MRSHPISAQVLTLLFTSSTCLRLELQSVLLGWHALTVSMPLAEHQSWAQH